jgi:hypothetical protein
MRALLIFLTIISVRGGCVHQLSWKKLKNFLKKEWPNQEWDPCFFASFYGFTSSPVELETALTWWKSCAIVSSTGSFFLVAVVLVGAGPATAVAFELCSLMVLASY